MSTAGMRFVGQRVPRTEDARFLTGHGTFVDDVGVPGVLHAAFARSDVARGRLVSVDVSAAREMPGVVAVYTAGDLDDMMLDFRSSDEVNMGEHHRPFRLFADHDVRAVGEPIAMVVAQSRYLAEDALDAIIIDIEPEDGVIVDVERALDDNASPVHAGAESNLMHSIPPPLPRPDVDEALAAAPVVLTETFRQHRYSAVPMETRGIVVQWERFSGQLTVWIATQGAHNVRAYMARTFGIDEGKVRVIMPDVGGGFGLKMNPRAEEAATAAAAIRLARPVKWIQDRRENLGADEQGRGDIATVTMGATEDGTLLAAKVEFLEDAGAFPSPHSSATVLGAMVFTGPYRLPSFAASGQTVYTNMFGRGGYRGPWMYETVVREQMIDCLAAELGIDPLELRRRNVVTADDLPYTMPSGFPLDEVTAAETLELAATGLGYDELREQQKAWRAEGRLVGIGVSLLVEPTAMAFGWMTSDAAIVRVNAGGNVDVIVSTSGHGQSIETTIAQVVADELDVDVQQVRVMQGDTDSAPIGAGTGGSRSAVIPGTAALNAAHEVRARVLAIVAHALEAAEDDLEIVAGRVQVKGTPEKGLTFAEVANKAYTKPGELPPGAMLGLEAESRFTPQGFCTWSNACHMSVVEVDPATGEVTILRYLVAEDCGVMINPNVVEGQIAGGVVQGIGGVLYERQAYDEAGNPLATTFVDYLLPTATEVPDIEYHHIETPASSNPGGHKGLGEGGAIAAPPCVINAVADALRPLGVKVRDQPLGPADVVALIEAAAAEQ
jgi:carbon-monoxide dehydrogenase large subunit